MSIHCAFFSFLDPAKVSSLKTSAIRFGFRESGFLSKKKESFQKTATDKKKKSPNFGDMPFRVIWNYGRKLNNVSPRNPRRRVSRGMTSFSAIFPRLTLGPSNLMNQTC